MVADTIQTLVPYSGFEGRVQYGHEKAQSGGSTYGYGKLPVGTPSSKKVILCPSAVKFWSFGNISFEPLIEPNRIELSGIGSRAPRYSRLGAREVRLRARVNPCPISASDSTYSYKDQTTLDMLTMAMGSSLNVLDDQSTDPWTGTYAPALKNHLPSIYIETEVARQGTGVTAGLWELYCGVVMANFAMTCETKKEFEFDLDMIAQDGCRATSNATTYGKTLVSATYQKIYRQDLDNAGFGSSTGVFGNNIPVPADDTIETIQTSEYATYGDAVEPVAAPWMWYESSFKYQYSTSYDKATGDLTNYWIYPANVVKWKWGINNNPTPNYGISSDGRKILQNVVCGQRIVSVDFEGNYDSTAHYKEIVDDTQVLYLKLKLPMRDNSTGNYKALLLKNGKAKKCNYSLNKADLIRLNTSCIFEGRASPTTYVTIEDW